MIKTRVITGAVLGIALVLTVLFLSTPLMAAILGVLWVIGAWEWAGLALLGSAARLAYAAACAAGMVVALLWAGADAAFVMLVLALAWWVLAFIAVLTYPRKFSMTTVGIVGFVVLLPSWFLFARLHGSGPLGRDLAMTVLAIVWAADVGAYTFGRLLGRVKLAPAVSPGKTWEGVGGGVLVAAAAAWGAALWLGLPPGGDDRHWHRHGFGFRGRRSRGQRLQTQCRAQGHGDVASGPRRDHGPDRQPHGRDPGLRARTQSGGPRELTSWNCRRPSRSVSAEPIPEFVAFVPHAPLGRGAAARFAALQVGR